MKRIGNKGFTLIELLVVIAIIGILSSVVLASLNTARLKARDAKRILDVKQLQNALQLYSEDNNGGYPSALSVLTTDKYIAVIPVPPLGAGDTAYSYTAIGVECSSYHIGVTLEGKHSILDGDTDAAASSGTNQCPDEATPSAKTDFEGEDPMYDVIP